MKATSDPIELPLITELLLLPDGRILVHNLTTVFAQLFSDLAPSDQQMFSRTTHSISQAHEFPN